MLKTTKIENMLTSTSPYMSYEKWKNLIFDIPTKRDFRNTNNSQIYPMPGRCSDGKGRSYRSISSSV